MAKYTVTIRTDSILETHYGVEGVYMMNEAQNHIMCDPDAKILYITPAAVSVCIVPEGEEEC